jgi:hypothetical protein
MTTKQMNFGTAAREKLLHGADRLADAVKGRARPLRRLT